MEVAQYSTEYGEYDRELRWFVLGVMSGAEWHSHVGLLERGIANFFPYRLLSARRGRYMRGVVVPEYGGYLFVGLSERQSSDEVERVSGVKKYGILRLGGRGEFIKLPLAQVNDLRAHAASIFNGSIPRKQVRITVSPGEWIAIPEGNLLAGLSVQVQSVDKGGRIVAQLGNLVVTLHVSDLAAAHKSVRGSSSGAPNMASAV